MTNVNLETVLVRSDDLLAAEVDGELTMMHVETGQYFGLTRVGAQIWEMLEEPVRVGDLCDRLVARYAVERDQCEGEVVGFLQRLVEEGIVLHRQQAASEEDIQK